MPINEERLRKMQSLGLTEYQARIYLTLLDLGSAIASQLPSLSRVPRTRIYSTMNQLHEKGLVEILPEKPTKYVPVPIDAYIKKVAERKRDEASELEGDVDTYSEEFAISPTVEVKKAGKFEAIHGRRNVRERLSKMYDGAGKEMISIGTLASPTRLVRARLPWIEEKSKEGLSLRYAFPVDSTNMDDVKTLERFIDIRTIDMNLPIYFIVKDSEELLFCHPIPNDIVVHRGDDIAIWTDDEGMVTAMRAIADSIWSNGHQPGSTSITDTLVTLTRRHLDLLGVDALPVFEALGRQVGVAMAKTMKAKTKKKLLDEIKAYWKEHKLGKVEIIDVDPMTIRVEDFIECSKLGHLEGAGCIFTQNVVKGVVDEKLGVDSVVDEDECKGQKLGKCRLTVAIPS
jgi:sugar-specific transcriptional regulator TrmB/predicted hydrocarbon binding protein